MRSVESLLRRARCGVCICMLSGDGASTFCLGGKTLYGESACVLGSFGENEGGQTGKSILNIVGCM